MTKERPKILDSKIRDNNSLDESTGLETGKKESEGVMRKLRGLKRL